MKHAAASMGVAEAAARRRSIRAFASEPIPRHELDAIFDVTRLAPSAWNLQPWRFVVVEDPGRKAQLAEAAFGQRQVSSAPAVIGIYTDMRDTLEQVDRAIHPALTDEERARARRSDRARVRTQVRRRARSLGGAPGLHRARLPAARGGRARLRHVADAWVRSRPRAGRTRCTGACASRCAGGHRQRQRGRTLASSFTALGAHTICVNYARCCSFATRSSRRS